MHSLTAGCIVCMKELPFYFRWIVHKLSLGVTAMDRHGKWNWDLPSGIMAASAVLGLAFLIGGVAGCLLAGAVDGEGGAALSDFLTAYLKLAQDGSAAAGFWAVMWEQFRFPLAAFVLGVTAVGVAGLPVLFAVRGFLFSFSVACFCRLFGGAGLIPALFLFGLPALLWTPALFVLGAQGMLGSYSLLRRVLGDSRYPLSFDSAYWWRCALCAGAVALCVAIELSIVPVLVGASARFVL